MKPDDLIENGYIWLDRKARQSSRLLARFISRRSFLGRLGAVFAGASVMPLLPVARSLAQEAPQEIGDPKSCEYWRYCAISGNLCACCGGTISSCPPGSEVSPITWVGTCHNPADDRNYLISYNDCCGKTACSRCDCHSAEREKPVYFPSKSSSITWCFGNATHTYHCTVAAVLAEAEDLGK